MMQRCSELGNNPEAWQQLFRFGKNKLKVKKGPNGHHLERECQDELKNSLPAKSFESLMSLVAVWMKRLDEKDKQVRLDKEKTQQESKKVQAEPPAKQQPSKDDDDNELAAVVDLCSDDEEIESTCEFDDDSFDTETVLSQSSVVIIDDDLGEVNLKDFADHVEGKLDAKTLKQRCHKQQKTKQGSILKYLSPRKPDALRRSVKTYAIQRKPSTLANEQAINEDNTMNEDPKILREVNREAGKKSRRSDSLVTGEVCQSSKANKVVTPSESHPVNNGDTTLVAADNRQQNVQIVTEPTAYYNLLAKPSEEHSELKCKSKIPENKSNVKRKSDPECVIAKENEPKNGFNVEQAETERTKEGAPPEESLTNQIQDQGNHVPQIRIRTDLGTGQMDVIRVRTDLLLEPPDGPPIPLGNQNPPEESLVPQKTAEKRRLSEAQSSPHQAKRPALESYNPQYVNVRPAPVVASSYQPSVSSCGYPSGSGVAPASVRPPPANPPAAPPVVTVKFRVIGPKSSGPVTSTTTSTSHQRDACPPSLPATSSHHHTAMNTPSVSSSGYATIRNGCPLTIASRHYPVNHPKRAPVTHVRHPSVNPVPAPPVASSNFPPVIPVTTATSTASRTSPIIPMITCYPPYQPPIPMASAPVVTSMYRPGAPITAAPPLPPTSYPQVPPVAPAPVAAMAGAAPPSGRPMLDPRTDLANIMGMLSQVELFAFKQENQEAFHLVSKLRNSLQRGANSAYH